VASVETLAGEVIPEATLSEPWALELKGIPGTMQVQRRDLMAKAEGRG
jgi:hypothetical protein